MTDGCPEGKCDWFADQLETDITDMIMFMCDEKSCGLLVHHAG